MNFIHVQMSKKNIKQMFMNILNAGVSGTNGTCNKNKLWLDNINNNNNK